MRIPFVFQWLHVLRDQPAYFSYRECQMIKTDIDRSWIQGWRDRWKGEMQEIPDLSSCKWTKLQCASFLLQTSPRTAGCNCISFSTLVLQLLSANGAHCLLPEKQIQDTLEILFRQTASRQRVFFTRSESQYPVTWFLAQVGSAASPRFKTAPVLEHEPPSMG